LYFANASFVKDMLLNFVEDLEAINTTEYVVLEMTPVISIDSSACHALEDIVKDFRSRNIQVAFAMVGNRVEKMMRKSGLKKTIGDQWFFPAVHEAVHYCVRHQYAKRFVEVQSPKGPGTVVPMRSQVRMHTSTEIGFSNDQHYDCTMVFITLARDVPMMMSGITGVLGKHGHLIVQAQIETLLQQTGSRHTYFIKCSNTEGKLNDSQIEQLRIGLAATISEFMSQTTNSHVSDLPCNDEITS